VGAAGSFGANLVVIFLGMVIGMSMRIFFGSTPLMLGISIFCTKMRISPPIIKSSEEAAGAEIQTFLSANST
jgi:hypothetical protein